MIRTLHTSIVRKCRTTCRVHDRCPSRCRIRMRCQWCTCQCHATELAQASFHSRTSFSHLKSRTVGSPMIAKTVLAHVVLRWFWFHFHFTFNMVCGSQLLSYPVGEGHAFDDYLLADCVAKIVETYCPVVWHSSPSQLQYGHLSPYPSIFWQKTWQISQIIILPPVCIRKGSLTHNRAKTWNNRSNKSKVASILPIVLLSSGLFGRFVPPCLVLCGHSISTYVQK